MAVTGLSRALDGIRRAGARRRNGSPRLTRRRSGAREGRGGRRSRRWRRAWLAVPKRCCDVQRRRSPRARHSCGRVRFTVQNVLNWFSLSTFFRLTGRSRFSPRPARPYTLRAAAGAEVAVASRGTRSPGPPPLGSAAMRTEASAAGAREAATGIHGRGPWPGGHVLCKGALGR